MGALRELSSGRSCILEPEHLVGRGSNCALRLAKSYVSTQHAVIRWNGSTWEVLDRSRNGTRLNGEPLEPRTVYPLVEGVIISFGSPKEQWLFVDANPPEVMIVDVQSHGVLLGRDGIIGIPSADDPQATVYRNVSGVWCLEHPDRSPEPLMNGASFEFASKIWRFCCPDSVASTTTADVGETREPCLHFSVSPDEEFVELRLEYTGRTIELGSRSHNYLLLALARYRLEDRSSGVPETSCGWVYKETLAQDLKTTPQQVDGDVFRIRKHFGEKSPTDVGRVIERRPRTRQLRIGIAQMSITRL